MIGAYSSRYWAAILAEATHDHTPITREDIAFGK